MAFEIDGPGQIDRPGETGEPGRTDGPGGIDPSGTTDGPTRIEGSGRTVGPERIDGTRPDRAGPDRIAGSGVNGPVSRRRERPDPGSGLLAPGTAPGTALLFVVPASGIPVAPGTVSSSSAKPGGEAGGAEGKVEIEATGRARAGSVEPGPEPGEAGTGAETTEEPGPGTSCPGTSCPETSCTERRPRDVMPGA